MSLAHPFISFSRKGAFFILVLSGLLLLLLAILSLLVPAAHAGQVTVAWDPNPEPEVAGYKIYYGTTAGNYTCIPRCGQRDEHPDLGTAGRSDVFLFRRGL